MNYVKRAMKTIINRFEVDISLYPARFRKKKIFLAELPGQAGE